MASLIKKLLGTDIHTSPSIEDFSLGATADIAEMEAELDAAKQQPSGGKSAAADNDSASPTTVLSSPGGACVWGAAAARRERNALVAR